MLVGFVTVIGITRAVARDELPLPVSVGVGAALALLLVLDGLLLYAVLRPAASLQDRLALTRLVPL